MSLVSIIKFWCLIESRTMINGLDVVKTNGGRYFCTISIISGLIVTLFTESCLIIFAWFQTLSNTKALFYKIDVIDDSLDKPQSIDIVCRLHHEWWSLVSWIFHKLEGKKKALHNLSHMEKDVLKCSHICLWCWRWHSWPLMISLVRKT